MKITKEFILCDYDWINDKTAFCDACIKDQNLLHLLNNCLDFNIIGCVSVENGNDGDNVQGFVEFDFDPEVYMLLKLGQTV
jgi:hypothetical protein